MAEERSEHGTWSAIDSAVATGGGSLQKLLALIWCEWLPRKGWLLGAGIIGLLVLLAPLLRTPDYSPMALLAVAVSAAFILCVPVFALAAGLSMNLQEISEQRSGFYLAKPVSGTLLWSGKFLAGLSVVVMLMVALALPGTIAIGLMWATTEAPAEVTAVEEAPSATTAERDRSETLEYLSRILPVSLAAVPIFVVSLWAGIAIGTRTGWLGFDFLILLAAGFLAWWAFVGMDSLELAAGAQVGAGVAAAVALIAFILAPAVSSSGGGIDKRRSHRLLALTLWPLITLGLLGQGLYYYWYLRPNLRDLESLWVVDAPPSGPWIRLGGPVWGRHGAGTEFLFNTQSGSSLHLLGTTFFYPFIWRGSRGDFSFSSSGTLAAWTKKEQKLGPEISRLHLARLEGPDAEVMSIRLPDHPGYLRLRISPEGSRCAVKMRDEIVLIRTRDLFVEHRVDLAHLPGECDYIHFTGESTLRCRSGYREVEIIDIELREEGWTASEQPPVIRPPGELVSPSRGTIVRSVGATESDDPGIEFVDGLTGEVRRRLAGEPHEHWSLSGFLSDDRVALFDSQSLQLNIFDTAGNVTQRIELARKPQSNFVLVDPKTILFTANSKRSRDSLELRAIDLETGHARKVGWDLQPVAAGYGTDRLNAPEPGSPISKLFCDRNGSLVFFDPLTGERETLLELGHRSEKEQDRG